MMGPLILLRLLRYKKQCEIASSSSHRKGSSAGPQTVNKRIDQKSDHKKSENSENSCRVCLKEADIDLPIFGGQNVPDLSQALSTFGGIEIDEADAYPKYLCQSCHTLLQGAIMLRETAQKSDLLLKKPLEHVDVTDEVTDNFVISDNFHDSVDFEEAAEEHESDLEFESIQNHSNDKVSADELIDQMKLHMKITCDVCNKPFSAMHYKRHRSKHEPENSDHKALVDDVIEQMKMQMKIACDVCNKSFSLLHYKKHRAEHEPDLRFMCDMCGKTFFAVTHLRRHKRTHMLKFPYECSLCPYKGRFGQSLRLHMRVHTGERPYECSTCAARFINKSNLNKHAKIHIETLDFKCESCGKEFRTKERLDMHVKIKHLQIRDHACDICGKTLSSRKQVMAHELSVHKRPKLKYGRMPHYLQAEKMKENIET